MESITGLDWILLMNCWSFCPDINIAYMQNHQ